MADKNPSPEKQLLKIIEEQANKNPMTSAFKKSKQFFSPDALKGRFSFLKSKFKDGFKVEKISFDLKKVNKVLQVGIIVLVFYFGVSLKLDFSSSRKEPVIPPAQLQTEVQAEPMALGGFLKPQNYYLEKIRTRSLFRIEDELTQKPVDFKEEKEKQSKLKEMTSSFKLVGISWSNDPDAIIEDEKAKKTYFIKTGHLIEDIKVQAILKDRVILHYQNEEVELK